MIKTFFLKNYSHPTPLLAYVSMSLGLATTPPPVAEWGSATPLALGYDGQNGRYLALQAIFKPSKVSRLNFSN